MHVFIKILIIIFVLNADLEAHPGGLDSQGGHFDRRTGQYHCHRPSCYVQQNKIREATDEVIKENRSFNKLYSREDWPHWLDLDGDCQDTRVEVLIRDSKEGLKFKDNEKCKISEGKWVDPYTDTVLVDITEVNIDHVVPLKWAHEHGAANWSSSNKMLFANDMDNLLAVGERVNQSKGALRA